MCFYKEHRKYQIAKEDLLVWKWMIKYRGKYVTLVQNYYYKLNELQPLIKIRVVKNSMHGRIEEGYHFFTGQRGVVGRDEKYIPFKIPKGTRFVWGYNFKQSFSGVSEQLVRITETEAKTLKEVERL